MPCRSACSSPPPTSSPPSPCPRPPSPPFESTQAYFSLTTTLLPNQNAHTVHTGTRSGTPALRQGRYRYFSGTFYSSVVECRWEAALGRRKASGATWWYQPTCLPQTFPHYRMLSLSKECICYFQHSNGFMCTSFPHSFLQIVQIHKVSLIIILS